MFMSQGSLDFNSPVCASSIAGMTGTHHHALFLLVEMGESRELFCPELAWNLDPPDLFMDTSHCMLNNGDRGHITCKA
jgi:hypothetical protein